MKQSNTASIFEGMRQAASTIISRYEEDSREIRKWKILTRVIVESNKATTNREMVAIALDAMVDLLDIDGGAAYLVNRQTRTAVMAHQKAMHEICIKHLSKLNIDDPPQDQVFVHGDTVISHQFRELFKCKDHTGEAPASIVAIPIISSCGIVGGVAVFSRAKREINPDEVEILHAICENLGHALRRLWAETHTEGNI